MLGFLRAQVRKHGFSRHIEEHLEALLRRGEVTVVIDGLNSLPADDYYQRLDRLKAFANIEFPLCRFVFTCRTIHHLEMLEFDTFVLVDLTPNRVMQMVRAYLPAEQAEAAERALKSSPALMRHCQRPFVLRAFAFASSLPTETPSSVSEIYNLFLEIQLNELDMLKTHGGAARARNALALLAFTMSSNGYWGVPAPMALIRQQPKLFRALPSLRHIASTAVLDISPDDREIAFEHQILQEFYASIYLREHLNEIDLRRTLLDPTWTEVVVLSAGLFEPPVSFLELILKEGAGSMASKLAAARVVHEHGLEGTGPGDGIVHELSDNIDFERIPTRVETRNDAGRIYTAVDSIIALAPFHNHQRAVMNTLLALFLDNPWIQQVALHALVLAPSNSRASQALLKLVRALPWEPSRFVPRDNPKAAHYARLRDRLESYLREEKTLLSESLKKELRFRARLKLLSNYRIWAFPLILALGFVMLLMGTNGLYSLFEVDPPYGLIGWFTEHNFVSVILPVFGVYVLSYLAVIGSYWIRDNREDYLRQAREFLDREKWTAIWSLELKLRLLFLGAFLLIAISAAASISIWLHYDSIMAWMERLLETQLGRSVSMWACLGSAVVFLLAILRNSVRDQRWFYARLGNRQIDQMLFEDWAPEAPLIERTHRKGLARVFSGACLFAFVAFFLGVLLIGRLTENPTITAASACVPAIAIGLPGIIITFSSARVLIRFGRQWFRTQALFSRLRLNPRSDPGLIAAVVELAANESIHSSLRIRALRAIGGSSLVTEDTLGIIEPLVASAQPAIRSEAAQASYQVRRRLGLPIPYSED